MQINWNIGLPLKQAAILIALFALAIALVACGGNEDSASAAELSALDATVAAQSAEIQSLSAQVSSLQSDIAAASASDEIAALQAEIDGLKMEVDDEPGVDYSDDIGALEDGIAELEDAISENADAIDSIPDAMSAITSVILGEHSDEHDGLEAAIQDAFDEHGAAHEQLEDAIEEAVVELIEEGELKDEEQAALVERLEWLQQAASPAITQAYVSDAIRYYNRNGLQATLAYYNTTDSMEGELYLFLVDANYNIIVNPNVPENIGQDIRGPIGTDITGKNYGAEVATTDAQGKWVDYVYLNPENNAQERKHTWVVRHGNLIFGSGWYERGISVRVPADYVRELVSEAIERYESEGRDAAVAYYNSPESVDGQYYVFAVDADDLSGIANPNLPDYVGRIPARIDPTGYYYGGDLGSATEEGKWISYVIRNPETGVSQRKHTWVALNDGIIWGSGWYEPITSLKNEPALYVRSLVDGAIERYEADGLDSTIEYYNSEESVDGQYYVFIGDENDVMLAHATIPDNVGKRYDEIVSLDGYPAGAQVAAAATEDGAWTSYTYINPTTGNVQTKHSWVIRHDGRIFGSGWYEDGASRSDSEAYSQALVERAINLYNDLGIEGTLDYYNSPESVDGQWYVVIIDEDDIIIGHYDDDVRGEYGLGPLGTDATGYEFGKDFTTAGEEGKWVSYVFNNPETGEPGSKHSWVVRHDGLLFASGWYTEPAEYTKIFVQRAIDLYEAEGPDAAIEYYNSEDSVEGQWYVGIIGLDGTILGHYDDDVRGESLLGDLGTDIAGYNYGADMVNVTEDGNWISYVYKNPSTGELGSKHSWVVLHDGLLFGSGWYASPADYTQYLVNEAIARYDADGLDSTVEYYNSEGGVDGQYYVFITDESDVLIAHANPDLVGVHLNDVISPSDGYPAGAQVAAAAVEGGAWTSYTYVNPATENVETKHSWVIRHDGRVFGSGWYEEGPSKSEPAEYVQSLVQRATNLYDDLGRDVTLDYYNTPESADGPWYVFVLEDRDGVLYSVANSNRPDIVGTTRERIDANGFNYGEAIAAVTEAGGGEWIDYLFTHPQTREDAPKHSWVVRRDNLFFGAGWYEGIEE